MIAYQSLRAVLILALSTVFIPVAAELSNSDTLDPISQPAGKVILDVAGSVEFSNGNGVASFDYEMLESLGLVEMVIDTPWTEAGTRFEGVKARDVMKHIGATGIEVHAIAVDGYQVKFPLKDLVEFNTLFALSMNGQRMSLRDKGPVWIIYDNEDRPNLPETEINSRMIWQLERLVIQ